MEKKIYAKKIIIVMVAAVILVVLSLVCVKCSKSKDVFYNNGEIPGTPIKAVDNGEDANADEGNPSADAGIYINNKELSAKDQTNGELRVGVNDSKAGGLIINPKYSLSSKDYKIGYYIVAEHPLRLQSSDESDSKISDAANVVVDWTYDKLKSVEYINDNDYGLAWCIEYDDATVKSDSFKLVVIDMTTHNIISTFTVEVMRNSNQQFELSKLYCSEVSQIPVDKVQELWDSDIIDWSKESGGTVSDNSDLQQKPFAEVDLSATRQQLIDAAYAELASGSYTSTEEPYNKNITVVELTALPYHLKYITPSHTMSYQGRMGSPVWAVTINSVVPTIGHYTIYFDKEYMRCIGCDYFYLNSEEELNSYIN